MNPEQIIQCQIVDYMSFVCQQNNFMYFSVPNESTIKAAFATNKDRMVEDIHGKKNMPAWIKNIINALIAILKKMGLIPGVADLVLVKNGRVYFMEVKTKKGKQSKVQTIFERRAGEVGAPYAIVRSLQEAKWTMEKWGIIG